MKTLYDIGDDLWAIDALLEDEDGDVTGQEEAIDAFLAEAKDNLTDKLTGYRRYMAHLDGLAEIAEAEAKRIADIARVRRNKIDRCKDRLYHFMTAHGIDKVVTPIGTFAIQKNGGALPIEIDDYLVAHPEELPEGYRQVEFKPDKIAIKNALSGGEELEFAQFGARGTHLRVK